MSCEEDTVLFGRQFFYLSVALLILHLSPVALCDYRPAALCDHFLVSRSRGTSRASR